jgi:hypothetical protein
MMNTVVWIMVMLANGSTFTTGPEFSTQEKCERASQLIYKAAHDKRLIGVTLPAVCVRIEK